MSDHRTGVTPIAGIKLSVQEIDVEAQVLVDFQANSRCKKPRIRLSVFEYLSFFQAVMSLMAAISSGWGSDLGLFFIGKFFFVLEMLKTNRLRAHKRGLKCSHKKKLYFNGIQVSAMQGEWSVVCLEDSSLQLILFGYPSPFWTVAVASFLPEVGNSFGPKPRKPKFGFLSETDEVIDDFSKVIANFIALLIC
ncbi:hypothetical protein L1987_64070 [Smallanthus sonchifolius]|uniref:Uncharacterized protein n=1 Tax=Smallanthus sonchifolius TaxID=185202 RepID=A0ACB9CFB5_9ASTR|nr:hypothetical protein L1987_64070 [Smallanthus sonchifolius]